MASTCNATSRIKPNETNPFAGTPAVYTNPQSVVRVHTSSWMRAGRTNDVSVLINGTQQQQQDYMEGILFAAVIFFIVFMVWMLIVLIFKCCGHKRVGFFSGQRIQRPMPPTPPEGESVQELYTVEGETDEEKAKRILAAFDDEDMRDLALKETDDTTQETPFEVNHYNQQQQQRVESTGPSPRVVEYCEDVRAWQRQVKKAERAQRRVRIVVIICCLGVIVSAILMVIKGVDKLMHSVQDVRNGLDQTAGLATTAIGLLDQFMDGQDEAVNSTEAMLLDVNTGFCPNLRDRLCADILTATDCDFSGIPYQEEIQQVVEYYDGAKDMVYQEVGGFQQDLQEIVDVTAEIDNQVASFKWAFYVASGFAIALAVLSLFILIGVIMAWCGTLQGSCFRWIRNCIVVPIYILLVFLSLLFSCIFIIGSMTTSDVCYNSPDDIVLQVLESKKNSFSTALYRFLTFYVGGCPEDVVPLDINNEVNTFLQYLDVVAAFLDDLQADQALNDTCGSNKSLLISGMQTVVNLICWATILILDVRDFLNCNNWNSVYSTFAYDAVCSNATEGFTWISSTQLAIVFFSMLIVTLRVACYEIEDEEDFLNQRRCCARICGCCMSSRDEPDIDDAALMKQEPPPPASPAAVAAEREQNHHHHDHDTPASPIEKETSHSAGASTVPTTNVTNVQLY